MKATARTQSRLFGYLDLLTDYRPRPARLFEPQRIILTKGSVSTPEKRRLVERICEVYPQAEVEEQLATPHNKVALDHSDLLDLHYHGRRTLVFGHHGSALGQSNEQGNTCPNFWHFSPYGFCPYETVSLLGNYNNP